MSETGDKAEERPEEGGEGAGGRRMTLGGGEPWNLAPNYFSPFFVMPEGEPSDEFPLAGTGAGVGAGQNIQIHLTGTEGEWDRLDEGQLIFSMDNDYPSISSKHSPGFSNEEEKEMEADPNSYCRRSPIIFPSPFSPIAPADPLGEDYTLSTLSPGGFLTPRPSPPSSPRPQLLTLVKSGSTDMARSAPEVSQSKSDSRLNLQFQWNKFTQPKKRGIGDSRTAPPSPVCLSPTSEGSKSGFFTIDMEDTKRKLTEAMHEPLSLFSKMMKDSQSGEESPKLHRASLGSLSQQPGSPTSVGSGADAESVFARSPRSPRKSTADLEPPLVFDWPSVQQSGEKWRRERRGSAPLVRGVKEDVRVDMDLHVASDDLMQVLAANRRRPGKPADSLVSIGGCFLPRSPDPLPGWGVFWVGLLSYAYLIVPLGPYLSGLALGVGLGFLLGLLLIRVGASKTRRGRGGFGLPHAVLVALGEAETTEEEPLSLVGVEGAVIKGWMNEMSDYDPEAYHPCLTQSVWASLEGGCLSLSYPKTSLPRRAVYDERLPEPSFTRTNSYQLAHCKVSLVPSVLASKRLWNPKYPICLQRGEVQGSTEGPGTPMEEQWLGLQARQNLPSTTYTLYLFGRTGREKEEWFHHFVAASMEKTLEKTVPVLSSPIPAGDTLFNFQHTFKVEEDALSPQASGRGPTQLDYPSYMARLLAAEQHSPLPGSPGCCSSPNCSPLACTCDIPEFPVGGQASWFNALIGRVFLDVLREKHWADLVERKIQKKLSRIRLPYFMEGLTLTELDMGSGVPQVTRASHPVVDHRGLWLQLDVLYTGALQMSLQTKFNLSRLGREREREGREGAPDTDSLPETTSQHRSRPVLSVLADSEEESSSAGSSDEEELMLAEPQSIVGEKGQPPGVDSSAAPGVGGGKGGKRRILRFVDKITKSKYFQKATENEFIKKKMEEMSNTPLLLTVEVQELSGPLVVNIPPPPTDRIWYSFCLPPRLDLRVRPKLGEREVTFCHVTDWIGRKLAVEFQKVLVMPNMDDICFPLMNSGIASPPGCQSEKSSPPPHSSAPPSHTDEMGPPLDQTDSK